MGHCGTNTTTAAASTHTKQFTQARLTRDDTHTFRLSHTATSEVVPRGALRLDQKLNEVLSVLVSQDPLQMAIL